MRGICTSVAFFDAAFCPLRTHARLGSHSQNPGVSQRSHVLSKYARACSLAMVDRVVDKWPIVISIKCF